MRHSRRGTLPERNQTANDELVGPILWEYYAGTERNGTTVIGPEEWLAHPGSVGRAYTAYCASVTKTVLSCLPATGHSVLRATQRSFEYHNAPDKTASATHPSRQLDVLGDVGYVDSEGYLI